MIEGLTKELGIVLFIFLFCAGWLIVHQCIIRRREMREYKEMEAWKKAQDAFSTDVQKDNHTIDMNEVMRRDFE